VVWYIYTSQNTYDILQITPDFTPDIWSTSPRGTSVGCPKEAFGV